MSTLDLMGFQKVVNELRNKQDDTKNQFEQLEAEISGLQRNKSNQFETIALRPSGADTTQTITTAGTVITIIKGFDKSKFTGKELKNLKNVRYYRYNTNFDAKYQINFSWYRLNSAANPDASSTDRIYCLFTFTGNYNAGEGVAAYENWVNDNNRNYVYFDFITPNE